MARQIKWLNQALRELYQHCILLEKSSPQKALQLEEECFQAVEILKQFPRLGRLVDDVEPEHRALLITSRDYWILYRIRGQNIMIAAVISTAQDFQKAWKSRKRFG